MNSPGAESHWIRIQSPNFEIYSTASEASTRETLTEFEQVRAFFTSNLANRDVKPLPVRIVQFSSEKEYQPYRINEFAAAYYKPGAEMDLIVMGRGGQENFPTAVHEYVHLVARHAGLNLPPWLNEGLADFYSTLRPYAGRIVIGEAMPGRLAEIQSEKWVPLSVILKVDHNSPYYNETRKAGAFYAESWALTHMLSLDADYRPHWRDFVQAILQGRDSEEAMTSVYGKPLAAIEKDLQFYAAKHVYAAMTVNAKLEKAQQRYAAEPAPEFDLKLMLLELAKTSPAEKEQQLHALAAQEPKRPETHEQLGYLLWGAGRPATQDVRDEFAKAYALGGRSPRMLWDYGRMLVGGQPDQAVQVLLDLSALEPERRDVKIDLAGAMLNANQPGGALSTILDLKGCTPEEAAQCMNVASFAYLRLNQRDKAKDAAELYLKVAKTPEDRQRAQQLLDRLSPPAAPALRPAPRGGLSDSPAADADPDRPVIARRPQVEEPPVVRNAPAPLPTVTGRFTEFDCGNRPVLVIDTGSAKQRFVIDDPGKIIIKGKGSDTIDLTCGAQKAQAVEVSYAPAPAGSKADGALRTLRFLP